MTNDERRSINRYDEGVNQPASDDYDEFRMALADLEGTGHAIRAESARIAAELWRWRFVWFWSQVAQVRDYGRLQRAYDLTDRSRMEEEDRDEVREILDDIIEPHWLDAGVA